MNVTDCVISISTTNDTKGCAAISGGGAGLSLLTSAAMAPAELTANRTRMTSSSMDQAAEVWRDAKSAALRARSGVSAGPREIPGPSRPGVRDQRLSDDSKQFETGTRIHPGGDRAARNAAGDRIRREKAPHEGKNESRLVNCSESAVRNQVSARSSSNSASRDCGI